MMKLDGHVPPRFAKVFKRVMYEPPIRGATLLAKNVIWLLNCIEFTVAWNAVEAMRSTQNTTLDDPGPSPATDPLPRNDRTASSIRASTSATKVTLSLYATMNCLSGRPCHIFVATTGTMMPRGRTIVGLRRAVVCLLRPNSTALRNLTLSLRAQGSRYVRRMSIRLWTAGSLTTDQSLRYVS